MWFDHSRHTHLASNTGTFSRVFLLLMLSTLLGVGVAACGGHSRTSTSSPTYGMRNTTPSTATGATSAPSAPSSKSKGTGFWTSPYTLDTHDFLSLLSCPSTQFCMAVDGSYGIVYTYNSGDWSSGVSVDPQGQPTSLSCPDVNFCVLVDSVGNAYIYRNGEWGPANTIEPSSVGSFNQLVSVGCSSSSWCVVSDLDGAALTYDHGTWSSPTPIPGVAPGDIQSLACPTSTWCMAADNSGDVTTLANGVWSRLTRVLPRNQYLGYSLTSLSCPSAAFCLALTKGMTLTAPYVLSFRGGQWSSPMEIATPAYWPQSVSCPTTTFCMSVGYEARTVTDLGHYRVMFSLRRHGVWTAPAPVDIVSSHFTVSVSCASTSFCVGRTSKSVFTWHSS